VLKLRAEAAQLLGYPNRAAMEIEIRMAKKPEAVNAFYEKLRPMVREKAKADFQEYLEAKKTESGNPNTKLHPWDQPYYEKYLQRTKYAVDARKVQEYFPFDQVIDGLFSITQALYGIEYRDITDKAESQGKPLWHPDVRVYEVWDKASNAMLGEFYIDLYPRENKYTHAACWPLVPRKVYADAASRAVRDH
jgi:thimet oligopeptidase